MMHKCERSQRFCPKQHGAVCCVSPDRHDLTPQKAAETMTIRDMEISQQGVYIINVPAEAKPVQLSQDGARNTFEESTACQASGWGCDSGRRINPLSQRKINCKNVYYRKYLFPDVKSSCGTNQIGQWAFRTVRSLTASQVTLQCIQRYSLYPRTLWKCCRYRGHVSVFSGHCRNAVTATDQFQHLAGEKNGWMPF